MMINENRLRRVALFNFLFPSKSLNFLLSYSFISILCLSHSLSHVHFRSFLSLSLLIMYEGKIIIQNKILYYLYNAVLDLRRCFVIIGDENFSCKIDSCKGLNVYRISLSLLMCSIQKKIIIKLRRSYMCSVFVTIHSSIYIYIYIYIFIYIYI
jgi:hypothetical protein